MLPDSRVVFPRAWRTPSLVVSKGAMLDLDTLATRMLRDYDRHTPGTPFADGLHLSIDEAYRLQSRVARRREARDEQVVGYKIGCVAPVNQARHGLSHPVWGRLWSCEQRPSGATLPQGGFANVAVEAELGVTLGRDVGRDVGGVTGIVAAVAQVVVAVELHNLVLRGGDPTGPELIANNAIHAGVVRSPGIEPRRREQWWISRWNSTARVSMRGRIAAGPTMYSPPCPGWCASWRATVIASRLASLCWWGRGGRPGPFDTPTPREVAVPSRAGTTPARYRTGRDPCRAGRGRRPRSAE